MAASKDLQSFIEARYAPQSEAYTNLDIDGVTKLYSKDVDFTDYPLSIVSASHSAINGIFTNKISAAKFMEIHEEGITGTKEFTVHRWLLRTEFSIDIPAAGVVKGQEGWFRGVNLTWWGLKKGGKEEEVGDWEIIKEVIYGGPVAGEAPI